MKNHIFKTLFLVVMTTGFYCSPVDVAGGSSSTDNGKITGIVSLENNLPARNTRVTLRTADYDPFCDTILPGIDTTDSEGKYEFDSLPSGIYTIEAVSIENGKRALVTSVLVDTSITYASALSLAEPGRIEVQIPECAITPGCYVYVPGTSCFGAIRNGIGYLDSVPAGYIPALYYVNQEDQNIHSVKNGMSLAAGETMVIADYSGWKHSMKIGLNTTASGAGVSGNVYQFPVLIRLSNDHFDFGLARPDGSDLRFKKPDDTPLPFEIESYDAESKQAAVWVKVDTVYGNSDHQYFVMYWGNPDARPVSTSESVFDTAKGFQGVWHLAEPPGSISFDATMNSYNGTQYGMNTSSSVLGIIGKALEFDGKSSYILILSTADSKINFPENGNYSVSLWANADSIDTIWHGIVSKGYQQYYLQYKCFHDTAASWEFVEFKSRTGWQYSEFKKTPAPGINQWIYLTGVRAGNRQYLYVNGELVIDTMLLNPNTEERITGYDFTIGCHLRLDLLPQIQGCAYFDGKIDEVRIMNLVPEAQWIKLCYMNQKEEDVLVEFR
ncbi:MAG: DUF2341 domain-containing protein [Chitinispirillaceae bacterium]|nr:DUF2341 domain-containing protein [Chitinispirillaceae bacterium]